MKTFKCWLVAQSDIYLLIAFLFCAIVVGKLDIEINLDIPLLVIAILALVLAIFICIFAWRNFEEVIPYNFMWRKSNVERFGMRLKYTIYTFFMMLLTFVFLFYGIYGLIMYYI